MIDMSGGQRKSIKIYEGLAPPKCKLSGVWRVTVIEEMRQQRLAAARAQRYAWRAKAEPRHFARGDEMLDGWPGDSGERRRACALFAGVYLPVGRRL